MSDMPNPMKAFAEFDFTRFFNELKVPGMTAMPGMDSFMAAYRRNMETLSAANRVALEGAQTVARRHMEIMQQAMGDLTETMKAIASTEGTQAKAAKQAELLKQSYERAVANLKELSDLIQKSNGEAIGLLNHRFTEAMDEVKAIMHSKPEV
jgi:phasin family protein